MTTATSRTTSDNRGPPPSQKRKIGAVSPHLSETVVDTDDNEDVVGSQRGSRLPAARLVSNNLFESPLPAWRRRRQGDTTEPTTPLSDDEVANGAYLSVLRQRVLKYARLQQADERIEEAIRLVPALVRLFPLSTDVDVVRDFRLPVTDAATEASLNAPFGMTSVWQRSLRLSFPMFVRDFATAESLPSFFVDESASVRTDAERAREWRQYYYLVYDLFDQLRKSAVIATQRVPGGDWREFYESQQEVTTSLLTDVPEEAFIITPEQMSVVGDVYDIAVSTFWPTPNGTRTHFNVLRWYSTFTPGEFNLPENAQARALLYARRHWSPRDHLRHFVVEHRAQFVRARAVLQVATAQWWSDNMPLDGTMNEHMTPQLVETRKQALERRIAASRRESDRFRRSLRALTTENRLSTRLARTRTILSFGAGGGNNDDDDDDDNGEPTNVAEEFRALAVSNNNNNNNNDREAEASDLLINQHMIEFQQQRLQALDARSQEDESELSHLDGILEKQRQATLEVVSYEIAGVGEPVLGAPLRAQNFAVLSSPLAPPEARGHEKRARVDIGSPRAIMFSESDEDDDNDNDNNGNMYRDALVAQVYRPKNIDRRATFQSKYRVNLNCILRYLSGWTTAGHSGALEYEFSSAYDCLLSSTLFPATIAHFIIWLAFSRAQATRNAAVASLHPAQSFDEETSEEAAERLATERVFASTRDLVNTRTFPALVNYAREL